MREKGQTEVAKTLETPVFSRGIEILTEKFKFSVFKEWKNDLTSRQIVFPQKQELVLGIAVLFLILGIRQQLLIAENRFLFLIAAVGIFLRVRSVVRIYNIFL